MEKKVLGLLCVLLTALFTVLPAGCASDGTEGDSGLFTITVVNNSRFAIELIDDTRVVPAFSEGKVTLPRYAGEVDDGYRLTYRVNLLDGVYIRIRRDENVVVHPAQEMLVIENAAFTSSETFVVLHNKSFHTVKVRYEEGYRDSLKEAGSWQRRYGSANIAARASALFDHIPPRIALSVESDNYRTTPFPSIAYRPGYRYIYTFDGTMVTLVDARPLHTIGQPLDAAIVFEGAIPADEQEALRETLNKGLAAADAPFRVPPEGMDNTENEGDDYLRYTFTVALTMGTRTVTFPTRREMYTGEVTVTLTRESGGNSGLIAEHKTAVTEFNEAGVYRAVRQFLTGDRELHQAIAGAVDSG